MKISALQRPKDRVHLDAKGNPLRLKPRPADTYRCARREVAKLVKRGKPDRVAA
jgi:hypothetical protein